MGEDSSDTPNYSGMTTNERLFVAGLLDAFEDAARRRDQNRMIELLCRVSFTTDEAAAICETTLSDPEAYGL
jgi:hypothetical protein